MSGDAPELAAAACLRGAVNGVFITHISTVIVSITQESPGNANIRSGALCVSGRTSTGWAVFLVCGAIVKAVVNAVAHEAERDAPPIAAGELGGAVAVPELAPGLVAVVPTIVVVIAAIAVRDAAPIAASEGC